MNNVIIIDDAEDVALYAVEALAVSFHVRFCSGNSLYETGCGKSVYIWRTDVLHSLGAEDCIIVLGENVNTVPSFLPHSALIIANALNKEQMEILSHRNNNVITCGNLVMDTVSYTSITDEEITVCLGRAVVLPDGTEIQPFEKPVRKSSDDRIYPVLAASALRIALGDSSFYLQ